MDGITELFKDQMTVVLLDIDNPADQPLRDQYSITDRSQYVLADAQGNVLKRWYGLLQEDELIADLQGFLDQQG